MAQKAHPSQGGILSRFVSRTTPPSRAEQPLRREMRALMPADTGDGFFEEIDAQGRQLAAAESLPEDIATALVFAARRNDVDPADLAAEYIETQGVLPNSGLADAPAGAVFRFDVESWLYIVKTFGRAHNLGFMADAIVMEGAGRAVTMTVPDAMMLDMIQSMRQNVLVSAVMGAAYLAHQAEVPNIGFRESMLSSDPAVLEQQKALLALGFDLGIDQEDGAPGILTRNAARRYAQMAMAETDTRGYSRQIFDDLRQARADCQRHPYLTVPQAFALRAACKRNGGSFDAAAQSLRGDA